MQLVPGVRIIKIQGFNIKSNGINLGTGIRAEQRAFTQVDSVFVENFSNALSTYYGYYLVRNSVFNKNRIYSYNDAGDAEMTPISQHVTVLNTSTAINLAGENIVNKYYNSKISNPIPSHMLTHDPHHQSLTSRSCLDTHTLSHIYYPLLSPH